MLKFLLLLLWPSLLLLQAKELTLLEVFEAAEKKSENLLIQEEKTERVGEKIYQASANFLPNLAIGYQWQRLETENNIASSRFSSPEQSNSKFTLSQSLFKGFKDLYSLKESRANYRAEEAKLQQTRIELYRQVAISYYQVLAAEQDQAHLSTLLNLTKQRVNELKERERIGRSRQSEVLSAKSQESLVEAQLLAANTALESARNNFLLVTGISPTKLALPHWPISNLKSKVPNLEKRPEIMAKEKSLEASTATLKHAYGSHLPSIDLSSNYYLGQTGVSYKTDWDLMLSVSFPLFQGGSSQSKVREAAQAKKEAELALRLAKRSAENEVNNIQAQVESLMEQIAVLTRAVETADRCYQAHKKDYQFGLVTNLELLQALNSFIEAKRSFDRTKYQLFTSLAYLDSASGEIPGQTR